MSRRPLWIALAAFAAILVLFVTVPLGMLASDPYNQIVGIQRSQLERAGAAKHVLARPGSPPLTYYRGHGNDPLLVLVHGFDDEASTWAPLAAEVGPDWKILAPDLPGHGESPATHPLSLADESAALEALIDDRNPTEPFVLVGNSMGGALALRYALDHPDRVRHLILVNSAGVHHPVPRELVYATTPAEFRAKLDAIFYAPPWMPDFVAADYARHAAENAPMAELFDDLANPAHALNDRLADVRVPTTLVWGAEDGYFPVSVGETFAAGIPGAKLVVVPACGHVPQRECPEALVAVLDPLK